MALYNCREPIVLEPVRKVTVALDFLNQGLEAWLVFFTYLVQTARSLRKLEIILNSKDWRNRRYDWWHIRHEQAAIALSPLKNSPKAICLGTKGFSRERDATVDERIGFEICFTKKCPYAKS